MPRMLVLVLVLQAALMGLCCAHARNEGGADALKTTVDTFHQRIRWRDFRAAAELIVPEKREAFLSRRQELGDEKDLSVTDYELEQARIAEDRQKATVLSRINWVRLPSVSEQSELTTTSLVFREGSWLIEAQQGGPFAGELEP